MEDVESFIVSSEDETVPTHVEAVERERLPADEAVCLHSVLHCLVAQPGGHGGECELRGVPVYSGAVPVTDVTTCQDERVS